MQSSSLETSVETHNTSLPRARHSFSTSFKGARERAARTSRHFLPAYLSATSLPMPELAPVMTTTELAKCRGGEYIGIYEERERERAKERRKER